MVALMLSVLPSGTAAGNTVGSVKEILNPKFAIWSIVLPHGQDVPPSQSLAFNNIPNCVSPLMSLVKKSAGLKVIEKVVVPPFTVFINFALLVVALLLAGLKLYLEPILLPGIQTHIHASGIDAKDVPVKLYVTVIWSVGPKTDGEIVGLIEVPSCAQATEQTLIINTVKIRFIPIIITSKINSSLSKTTNSL
ncbi:MAG TPA: hypothetical protein PLJ08_01760 [Cyclobacteriaceae bacterium]|nr:hypothetical protein [Cyclobacteriaceae bacterium]